MELQSNLDGNFLKLFFQLHFHIKTWFSDLKSPQKKKEKEYMCGLQSLLAWPLQMLNFLLENFRQQFQNLKTHLIVDGALIMFFLNTVTTKYLY